MIVTVGHADAGECAPTIVRSIESSVEHVNRLGIFRIGVDARVVPRALAQIALLVRLGPRPAAVVRTEYAAVFRFDNRPQTIRVRGRYRDPDNSDRPFWQALVARDFRPGIAAVG